MQFCGRTAHSSGFGASRMHSPPHGALFIFQPNARTSCACVSCWLAHCLPLHTHDLQRRRRRSSNVNTNQLRQCYERSQQSAVPLSRSLRVHLLCGNARAHSHTRTSYPSAAAAVCVRPSVCAGLRESVESAAIAS